MSPLLFVNLFIVVLLLDRIEGHGMMLDPPSRSSMWRFGFKVPANYDDDGLYCGGFGVSSRYFEPLKTLYLDV